MFSLPLLIACTTPFSGPGGDILLITLDTTRADAVGVYGGPEGVSPNLDSLAQGGLRLDMALAHAPTTLSSHSSMFTGLDPHGHGVPHNGIPLESKHETVAERLEAAGWDTLAVVGASAVDNDSGIGQGFRVLDDHLDQAMKRRYEADAKNVTDRALALVARRQVGRRLFLWVHYYDAHSPYAPPAEIAARFVPAGFQPSAPMDGTKDQPGFGDRVRMGMARPEDMQHWVNLYHAEVSWIDVQIGRLLQGLREQGVLQRGWIVVAGDHGEMFYEEPLRPMGHGPDIDLVISRVPLILHPIGAPPKVSSSEELVGLMDLAPTLLGMADLEPVLGSGRDLSPLLRGEALRRSAVFLEATKPSSTDPSLGWNNLIAERGVALDGYFYVHSPWSKEKDALYRLLPGQPVSLDPKRELVMRRLLEAWDQTAPPFRDEELLPSVKEALRALGYVE